MEKIKRILREEYGLIDMFEDGDGVIYAQSDLITCQVVMPHSGTDNKWMIRFSTVAGFDRWANSCAIEIFFEYKDELLEYLERDRVGIYEDLLRYLSDEYFELEGSEDGCRDDKEE